MRILKLTNRDTFKCRFYRCVYPRHHQNRFNERNGRQFEEKNQRLEEKTIMDSILDEKIYDARIRPSSLNSSDGPTNIQVNLMIRSIDKMDFSVQITFRYAGLSKEHALPLGVEDRK